MGGFLFGLALSSALLHASWNFATKRVGGRLEVVVLGLGIAAVVLAPSMLLLDRPPDRLDYYYIAMTGLLQAAYFLTIAGAYRLGEMSALYPLARGTGILVSAAIGIGIAGETVSPLGAVGIGVTVLGTFLLGAYELGRREWRALVLAVLTGISAGGSYLYGKLAVERLPPVFYVWTLAFSTVLLVGPFCWWKRREESVEAWRRFRRPAAIIGLGSMTSYLIALYAFRAGNMSYVVPVRECSVVFGAVLGVLFLGERLTPRKALAVLAIAAGAVLIKLA